LPSLSHQGTPSPADGSSTSITTEDSVIQKRQKGPSDYEMRREAKIAENKRLLASLGLSEGGSNAILGKSSTNAKRKKGEKGKGKEFVFCLHYSSYPS
jgi:hypothetical protein